MSNNSDSLGGYRREWLTTGPPEATKRILNMLFNNAVGFAYLAEEAKTVAALHPTEEGVQAGDEFMKRMEQLAKEHRHPSAAHMPVGGRHGMGMITEEPYDSFYGSSLDHVITLNEELVGVGPNRYFLPEATGKRMVEVFEQAVSELISRDVELPGMNPAEAETASSV
jgi:hypothetical protein